VLVGVKVEVEGLLPLGASDGPDASTTPHFPLHPAACAVCCRGLCLPVAVVLLHSSSGVGAGTAPSPYYLNKAMHRYPFVKSRRSPHTGSRKRPENPGDIRMCGKTCHLCDDGDDGPGYDLWHVLFECPETSTHPDIAAVCESCVSFLPRLCDAIEEAVRFNGTSMSMSLPPASGVPIGVLAVSELTTSDAQTSSA
jgi:hypothetical protein